MAPRTARSASTKGAASAPLDRYDQVRELGRGSYGHVHLVRRRSDRCLLAMKSVSLPPLASRDEKAVAERRQALREVDALQALTSPYIVRHVEVILSPASTERPQSDLHIITEYCDAGDLSSLIRGAQHGRGLTERDVWSISASIIAGMCDLHRQQILHRDLKPANIFLRHAKRPIQKRKSGADGSGAVIHLQGGGKGTNGGLQVLIGDLGLARTLGESQTLASTMVGTPHYCSPEIFDGKTYGEKADVYSFGVCVYEMMHGSTPHADVQNIAALAIRVLQLGGCQDDVPKIQMDSCFSEALRGMVTACLSPSPEKRCTADELMECVPSHHRITSTTSSPNTSEVSKEDDGSTSEPSRSPQTPGTPARLSNSPLVSPAAGRTNWKSPTPKCKSAAATPRPRSQPQAALQSRVPSCGRPSSVPRTQLGPPRRNVVSPSTPSGAPSDENMGRPSSANPGMRSPRVARAKSSPPTAAPCPAAPFAFQPPRRGTVPPANPEASVELPESADVRMEAEPSAAQKLHQPATDSTSKPHAAGADTKICGQQEHQQTPHVERQKDPSLSPTTDGGALAVLLEEALVSSANDASKEDSLGLTMRIPADSDDSTSASGASPDSDETESRQDPHSQISSPEHQPPVLLVEDTCYFKNREQANFRDVTRPIIDDSSSTKDRDEGPATDVTQLQGAVPNRAPQEVPTEEAEANSHIHNQESATPTQQSAKTLPRNGKEFQAHEQQAVGMVLEKDGHNERFLRERCRDGQMGRRDLVAYVARAQECWARWRREKMEEKSKSLSGSTSAPASPAGSRGVRSPPTAASRARANAQPALSLEVRGVAAARTPKIQKQGRRP